MKWVDNRGSRNPFINLALEEYLLRTFELSEEILILYVNRPSVVIGRNQNIWEEADLSFLAEKGIDLARRLSGGGAVYHDAGNLNYSVVAPFEPQLLHDFNRVTAPIIHLLKQLGLPAFLNERNDIYVGDFKISGTAQFTNRRNILSHGTLLFEADLVNLSKSLRPRFQGVRSKSIKSVRSRVVNVQSLLDRPMGFDDFRQRLRESYGDMAEMKLNADHWQRVLALARDKYHSWQWTVARSPVCTIPFAQTGSEQGAELTLEKGIITDVGNNGPKLLTGRALDRPLPEVPGVALEGLAWSCPEWSNP